MGKEKARFVGGLVNLITFDFVVSPVIIDGAAPSSCTLIDAFPFALNHLDAKFFGEVGILSANHHFDLFFQDLVFHHSFLSASGLFRSVPIV